VPLATVVVATALVRHLTPNRLFSPPEPHAYKRALLTAYLTPY
jgi:hypothetical protein